MPLACNVRICDLSLDSEERRIKYLSNKSYKPHVLFHKHINVPGGRWETEMIKAKCFSAGCSVSVSTVHTLVSERGPQLEINFPCSNTSPRTRAQTQNERRKWRPVQSGPREIPLSRFTSVGGLFFLLVLMDDAELTLAEAPCSHNTSRTCSYRSLVLTYNTFAVSSGASYQWLHVPCVVILKYDEVMSDRTDFSL